MNQMKSELKIMGINPILTLSTLVVIFTVLAVFAGDLLYLSYIGFEVIFPFFSVIAVGEWGRIKADDNYDVIAAQARSLFSWVLSRFITVFATVSLYAFLSMIIVSHVRDEMPLWEMVLIYIPPALFLSTLTVLFNLYYTQEHISTLNCGIFWLITMFIKSLLRIPGVEYVYLFIRYSGDQNDIWLMNKTVLIIICGVMWGGIYLSCQRKSGIIQEKHIAR